MVLPYMVTWIPSIYPSHVTIYGSTMDPMGYPDVWFIYQWRAAGLSKALHRALRGLAAPRPFSGSTGVAAWHVQY